jgi:hypothetical protein
MVLLVMVGSGVVVFYGKASSLIVGLLIGTSAMLTQLLFVVMIVFFVFAESAESTGPGKSPSFPCLSVCLSLSFSVTLSLSVSLCLSLISFRPTEL